MTSRLPMGKMFVLIGLLVAVVIPLPSSSLARQPGVPVTVNVTVDGHPADALIRILQDGRIQGLEYTDVHTPGRAQFQLSPGEYQLRVEHGAGFTSLPAALDVSVKPGTPLELAVQVEPQLDPRAMKYYSADLHVHTIASAAAMRRDFGIRDHGATPVDQVVGVQLAADLDVMFISDHNSVDGHELFAQTARKRGVPFVLSEEITTLRWGHFNPYSLHPGELVEFKFDKLPSQFFEEARAKGATMIQVNHPTESIGGYFLTRNRLEFDPSFDAAEVFNGSFDESDFQTVLQMFRFWNEGQRYVATAVSDDHDWKELGTEYGTPRTYVFVEGALSAEAFIAALQAGHAFVTYGPMLFLTANAGSIPGDTVLLSPGEQISLTADIHSVLPLDGSKAEIVRNGERIQSFELNRHNQTISFEDAPRENGWYIVRVVDARRTYLALTNPIWVEVE
jgi:hypothetical protein